MNFFELELKKICDKSRFIDHPKYVSRACVFKLSDDVTGRIEFVKRGTYERYEAIKISLVNRISGPIDTQFIDLLDVFGKKNVNGFLTDPVIRITNGNIEWFGFEPLSRDYRKMAEMVDDYLSCFTDKEYIGIGKYRLRLDQDYDWSEKI